MMTFICNDCSPLGRVKTERNTLCPCGSGQKAKKCCGAGSRYFLTGEALRKRIEEEEKKRANEKKRSLDELIHD